VSIAASNPVLILGASARAAAFSAWRAGLAPWCADLFADADLCRLCPVRRIDAADYPAALFAALADAPAGPVLYAGALENYPGLLVRLVRPLWGNPPDVVRRVRSPFLLADVLHSAGLPCLDVRSTPSDDVRHWLLKPLRGAAGLGVRPYHGQPFDPARDYLQEFADGPLYGATYLGQPDGGAARLLGVTRQLCGCGWLHANRFHYCGSVGPVPLHEPWRARLLRLGEVLVRAFRLRGLFGVDLVERGGEVWPLEVNPRYTASVEILERGLGVPLLSLHRAVFEGEAAAVSAVAPGLVFGKAILFARDDLVFPADGPWMETLRQPIEAAAEFADIPHPGEPIEKGRPVLTLFATGETVGTVVRSLRETARALDRRLWGR
jgi:uncharacterized protein